MKEYYGAISFSGRVTFAVVAEDEESAKNIVMNEIEMNIGSRAEDILSIEEIEWDLIFEEPRGNVSTPFVQDFELYEED